jgi:uncharacterized protein (TIGR02996 family)
MFNGRTGEDGGMEEVLLQALHADPADDATRLVLADWLEEQGDVRGELLRLHVTLRQRPAGADLGASEERLRALLAAGVRPCVPLLTNSVAMELALIPRASSSWARPTARLSARRTRGRSTRWRSAGRSTWASTR